MKIIKSLLSCIGLMSLILVCASCDLRELNTVYVWAAFSLILWCCVVMCGGVK